MAASYSGPELDILIDQGRDDQFLSASQLLPDNLIAACSEKKIPVVFRLQQVSSVPFDAKKELCVKKTVAQKSLALVHPRCIEMSAYPSVQNLSSDL